MIETVRDRVQGKIPKGTARSDKWPEFRKNWFKEHGEFCRLCGGKEKVELHHIQPFHLAPNLELAEVNVIALCESEKGGLNCHLAIGHLGSFKSFNPTVVADIQFWHDKIVHRPD
jgi:hypothetical protein